MSDSDVLLVLIPSKDAEKKIYKSLILNSELQGNGVPIGKFHITLAWVKHVNSIHQRLIIEHFENAVQSKLFEITFDNVDRYLVGQDIKKNIRTFNNSPLVVYPTLHQTQVLKYFNKKLNNALAEFNCTNSTNYSFAEDVKPCVFEPHMTLVDTKTINKLIISSKNNLDRLMLIKNLNNLIKTYNLSFEFMLKNYIK